MDSQAAHVDVTLLATFAGAREGLVVLVKGLVRL